MLSIPLSSKINREMAFNPEMHRRHLWIALSFGIACTFLFMSSLTTTSVQHAACPQVIVSLATFGERAFLIKDVVRSLTQTQSIQPDMVVVHVTEASAQLTTFVKKEFNCTLGIPCGRLLIMPGPATKLLGTLRLFPQLPPDACIITVDDDTIYGQHLVRTLTSRALDNAALGLSWSQPYQHMAKNASNALSMVPDTMRTRQWPCVQHFEQLHA